MTRRAFVVGASLAGGALAAACGGAGAAPERVTRSTEPMTIEVWVDPPNADFAPYWENTLLP
jgi:hypothetical protein